MLSQRRTQPLEVAQTQRDRTSSRRSTGRVRTSRSPRGASSNCTTDANRFSPAR
jgi:hypothetical protein